MALQDYKKKRKFNKTPEPKAQIGKKDLRRFVVQEHNASHLHYDFRLEWKGVLKSWAVPKGVPEEAGIKRLAMQVEDHPVDYIDFEGIIPAGEYGAGEVRIWDNGNWELIEGSPDLKTLKIKLNGKKLKGEYAMAKFKGREENGKDNKWLLFRVG